MCVALSKFEGVLNEQGSASPEQTAVSEREVAKLQGSWRQVHKEADGIENPDDEFDVGAVTTFSRHSFTVRNLDGSVALNGTFSIDASVSPKAIDWVDSIGPDAGKVLPASYTLEGDTFVFIAGDEGAQRPTAFVTTIGQTMRTFARVRLNG